MCDRLTTICAEDYIASRLRKVTRHTVKKEISVLRRLAKWAHRRGYLESMLEIETPGARVVGATVGDARKRTFLVFTAAEVGLIIANLPEYAIAGNTLTLTWHVPVTSPPDSRTRKSQLSSARRKTR